MNECQIIATELSEDGNDFVVSIKRPCGPVVKVLIPVDGTECLTARWCSQKMETPMGLNFITEGHYY